VTPETQEISHSQSAMLLSFKLTKFICWFILYFKWWHWVHITQHAKKETL